MIREYKTEDYDGIVEVWKECFSGTLRPIDTKENMAALVERGGVFLVAEEENKLIGTVFAGYDGRQAVVHRLAVLPEYQKKGIGSALMVELMKKLEGKKPIELLAHADPEEYVINIYEKFGLKKTNSVYMKKKIY